MLKTGIKRPLAKLRNFLNPSRAEQDLERELKSHLTLLEDDLAGRGMTREQSRIAAELSLGGIAQLKQLQWEERSFVRLEQLCKDLRFSFHMIARQPILALAIMTSLGLGLGANTAVFTLLNGVAFRSLPVPHPEQLVRIGSHQNNGMIMPVPASALAALRKEPSLQGICGVTAGDALIEIAGDRKPLATHSLTGDCYQTLGVHPAIGRLLTPADDIPDGPHVAVLGYAFWKSKFGGNPGILGRTILVDGKPFQIVGVTEKRFQGLLWGYPPSVSAPISQRIVSNPNDPSGRFYWADTIARLGTTTSVSQLQNVLAVKWRRLLDQALPLFFKASQRDELLRMPVLVASAASGVDYYFRDHFLPSLAALLTVSLLLLFAACFNVANLLLARGWQRQQEIAIRLALGAPRSRIMQQLLLETTLLLIGGLGVAFGISLFAIRLVIHFFLETYGRADFVLDIPIDAHVFAFLAGAAILVLLIAGVVPAWHTSDVQAASALKRTSRSLLGGLARSRRTLLTAQIAMTLIVLVSANLFTDSLRHLESGALRFSGSRVLNLQLIPLPGSDLAGTSALPYLHELLTNARLIPGVENVSLSSFAPLVSLPYKEDVRRVDQPQRTILQAPAEFVTEEFVHVMHIPLLQGRLFEPADSWAKPRVGILSQSVARRLFPHENPLGQHIQFGTEPETRNVQVVGVVADNALEDAHFRSQGFVLLSLWQLPRVAGWGNLQVQFSGPAAPVAKALREKVRSARRQEVFQLRTLSELRDTALLQERLLGSTGAIYSALALLLTFVGLFGLLTFFATSREKELALRIALGAGRSNIGMLVVREGLVLACIGTALGLPLCLAASRLASNSLYEIAFSPESLILPIAALFAALMGAAFIPVSRAVSLDPNLALRQN
jgi:predicted permease